MNHNILLAAIIIIAAVVSWLIWMLMRPEFFREMQFLNMEISRNSGELQKMWIQQRRRLLLSMIPFVKYRK